MGGAIQSVVIQPFFFFGTGGDSRANRRVPLEKRKFEVSSPDSNDLKRFSTSPKKDDVTADVGGTNPFPQIRSVVTNLWMLG
jgi:hypothetical protein